MEDITQFSACTISSPHFRCFEKLKKDELKLLDDNSVKIKYKKGEIICKQGGFFSQVMYVENGLAKVFMEGGANSLVLKIIPDTNLIGLASVSEEQNTYPYSAMAYIDTVVRQIDIKVFRQLLRENSLFALEIIDILNANSLQIYGRFFCLTQKQSFGRLADIILCLADRIFKRANFDLPLSRKDLAELTGLSAETVIRILKKFNEEGLIRMDGKKFEVLDYESLQRISETG